MEVMPGNPHALAVATRIPSISSPGGVAIFDDGVKRPKEVADVNVIEFGSSSILYGCYLGISSSPFSTMAVDASGLSVVNTTSGFCGSDFKLDGGLAYTLNGTVFQPQTRQPVTSYVIDFGKSGSPVAFKPDSLLGRTFFLTSGSAGYKELLIFDQNAFGLVGSVQLTNAFSGVGTVIRWGDDGLAYRTGLYEIDLLHIPREWLSPVQSTQFAHIGNGTGLSTSVLVTNPSASTVATGSINFFSDSGSNFSLFSQFAQLSTVPFAVPPLGLFRYSTNGHDNLLTGSAKVVTNAAASGVVKFGAPGLGIAGVGASVPARAIILPVVRDAKSKLNTGVAIANPGKDPTGVQISLRTLSGQNVPGALTLITLAANAHTARFIDELFPAIDTANFQGTLVASALSVNANIAATAIQIGAAPGEFTTLPVASLAPPTTARELSFPQFANGSGFTSSFFLTNPSPNTISGVIRFYDDNGSPISVPMEGASRAVEIPLSIPSLGAVILTTAGGETLQSGSARVTADGPIGGVLRYNFPGLGLAGVGASDPAAGFLLPVTRNADAGRSTGIGIAAGSSAVNLVFTLRTSAGEPVPGGETRLNLPANGHTARFIHELFPQADTRAFEGTLTVTAEGGLITATGIEIGSTAGEFTTLPASVLQ
jgi:hypothetical protein